MIAKMIVTTHKVRLLATGNYDRAEEEGVDVLMMMMGTSSWGESICRVKPSPVSAAASAKPNLVKLRL